MSRLRKKYYEPIENLKNLESPGAYRREWTSMLDKLVRFLNTSVESSDLDSSVKVLIEENNFLKQQLSIFQEPTREVSSVNISISENCINEDVRLDNQGVILSPEGAKDLLECCIQENAHLFSPCATFNLEKPVDTTVYDIDENTAKMSTSDCDNNMSLGSKSFEIKEQKHSLPEISNLSKDEGKSHDWVMFEDHLDQSNFLLSDVNSITFCTNGSSVNDCCCRGYIELVEELKLENRNLFSELQQSKKLYDGMKQRLGRKILDLEDMLDEEKKNNIQYQRDFENKKTELVKCSEIRLYEAYKDINKKEEALTEQTKNIKRLKETSMKKMKSLQEDYEAQIEKLQEEMKEIEKENVRLTETVRQQAKLIDLLQTNMDEKANKTSRCNFY